MTDTVVLAFSGGLDTSFCVPYLIDQGYSVATVFVDTGGVDAAERDYIAQRSRQLGAAQHHCIDAGPQLFQQFIVPFLHAGRAYQDQYPLLCSDRYIIVEQALKLCDRLGTQKIAHGCTAMGNDQIRFDSTVKALGDYDIIAPIREIHQPGRDIRDYEKQYLKQRGFDVRSNASRYTINENLLGVTISGAEIDAFETPLPESYVWCAPPEQARDGSTEFTLTFEHGIPVRLNGDAIAGDALLKKLNHELAPYGIGRGTYTGDTTIGLKGRIAFEAPGMTLLMRAHRALEEAVLTTHQNRFKSTIASQWVQLTYEGLFFEPLKADIEAYLTHQQQVVSGDVTCQVSASGIQIGAIRSASLLTDSGATYAQQSDWSAQDAQGFIRLFGNSSHLYRSKHRGQQHG